MGAQQRMLCAATCLADPVNRRRTHYFAKPDTWLHSSGNCDLITGFHDANGTVWDLEKSHRHQDII